MKINYLDWLYKKDIAKDPYNNIEEILDEAKRLADSIGINPKTEILPLKDRIIMK